MARLTARATADAIPYSASRASRPGPQVELPQSAGSAYSSAFIKELTLAGLMTKKPKLQGIFTPNIVPLDPRGEINESELRRYTSWLIERGVHGLYPNGSTGEFTRFTT